MKEYTEQDREKLVALAKEKARRLGIGEDAIRYIDSHSDIEKSYQIGNIEDFLKLPDDDISEYSFVEWFTLDNE